VLQDHASTWLNTSLGSASGVAGVRAGGSHTCARLTTGEMKCWGLNGNGQLGDGTTIQRLTPVTVSGITSGAVSMGIGYAHSCVMMMGNSMKCWGANDYFCFTNPSACLYTAATVTQNIATLIDIPFAITEAIFIVGECIGAPLAGCATGAFMGQAAFNLTGANAAETSFSLASLALTFAADALDDGQLGEPTGTSLVTFLAGALMLDPIGDVIIDGYASGYNNGTFNGINTLMNGGPLVIPK